MTLWTMWLDAIRSLLGVLSSDAGLGLGLAIIVVTLLVRTAILPISWNISYRNGIRQRAMKRLQPELQSLKERFSDKPEMYMQQLTALYRKHGLTMVDGKSLLGGLAQMPLLLGMFQVLRNVGDGVRFLWIPNLLRPDAVLAVIAGITTVLMIMVNPDMPEQMRLFMIVVPSVIAVIAALKFCSALAVYWAASNCFSALQTLAVHALIRQRIRSGALKA